MMGKNRLSIKEAATLMEVSEQFVRVGLQNNKFPFGYAIRNKTRWNYYISPVKFTEATGIQLEE